MRLSVIAMLALLLPGASWADVTPISESILTRGVRVGTLCSAETTTGDCASTDEIVLDARAFNGISFFGHQSTASAYTCDVIMSDQGHDDGSGEGQDVTASAITETNQIVSLSAPLGFLWINCSTITGGAVTITYVAQPANF